MDNTLPDPKAELKEKSPVVQRLEKAGNQLSNFTMLRCKSERDIGPDSAPAAEIIINGNLELPEDADLNEVLSKLQGKKVGLYCPGIGKGIEFADKETQIPLTLKDKTVARANELIGEKLQKVLIPKSKYEQKFTAADFLIDEGFDAVITMTTGKENRFSSLAADAIAKKTILTALKEAGIRPEMYTFSDGGFKEFQIHLAAFTAILADFRYAAQNGMVNPEADSVQKLLNADVKDLEDILLKVKIQKQNESSQDRPEPEKTGQREHLWKKVFLSGYDALNYIDAEKDVDIITGSSPAGVDELAAIPAYNRFLPLRLAQNLARIALNKIVIEAPARHEDNPLIDKIACGKYLPGNAGLYLSRLFEIGRAKGLSQSEIDTNESACKFTTKLMSEAIGSGKIVYLTDRSGKMVDTTAGGIINGESLIFGQEHTLFIQTQPGITFTDKRAVELYLPPEHDEIKRVGAVTTIRALIAASRLDLLTAPLPDGIKLAGRYIPASIEVTGRDENGARIREPFGFDFKKLQELQREKESLTDRQKTLLTDVVLAFETDLLGMGKDRSVTLPRQIMSGVVAQLSGSSTPDPLEFAPANVHVLLE